MKVNIRWYFDSTSKFHSEHAAHLLQGQWLGDVHLSDVGRLPVALHPMMGEGQMRRVQLQHTKTLFHNSPKPLPWYQ